MIYDLIIIGAGPAGLTASIYASRYGLKHLLIGALSGGLASTAYSIENYPGYKKISGGELMKQFTEQAKTYGIEILPEEIANIKKKKEIFEIKTNSDKKFQTKTIILALGTQHRKLGIPGEKKFLGRGISYCTTCDGPLYKDKVVAVVGGGDSALTSAIFLIKLAKKVYLIHRRKEFRAKIIWRDKINQSKKIVKVLARQIKEIKGNRVIQEII